MKLEEILGVYSDNRQTWAELKHLYDIHKIVPFVGAGLGAPTYPLWGAALRKILNDEDDTELNTLLEKNEFEDAGEYVYNRTAETFFTRVGTVFSDTLIDINGISHAMKLLPSVFSTSSVITSNFDRLIETVYCNENKNFDGVFYLSNTKRPQGLARANRRFLFKIHGDVIDQSSLVFTRDQYEKAYSDDSFFGAMEEIFSQFNSVLFLGCSLSGNDRYLQTIKQANINAHNNNFATKHFAFLAAPKGGHEEMKRRTRQLEELNIYPIWYPVDTSHSAVPSLLEYLHSNQEPSCLTVEEQPHPIMEMTSAVPDGVIEEIYYTLRKEFIDELYDTMQGLNHPAVTIWGDGGLGKTTTALWLYNCFHKGKAADCYEKCMWVEYDTSLDNSLLATLNMSRIRRDRDEQLSVLLDYLKSDTAPKILMVINDVSVNEFDDPQGVITLQSLRECDNIDLIITTRTVELPNLPETHLRSQFEWRKMLPLDEPKAVELFKYYFSNAFEISSDEEALISDIVQYVNHNPLLIEVISKAAAQEIFDKGMGLREYWETIIGNEDGEIWRTHFPSVEVNTNYTRESSKKSASTILRDVYSFSGLSEQERRVLWSFAILPNTYIHQNNIEKVLSCDKSLVDGLFKKGWLKLFPGKGYQMHDIVKSMIWIDHVEKSTSREEVDRYSYSFSVNQNGYAPVSAFDVLVENETWDSLFSPTDKYEDICRNLSVLKACEQRVRIPDSKVASLLQTLAHYSFWGVGDKKNAEKYYKKALVYVDPARVEMVIRINFEYAYLLSSMGSNRYGEAEALMEKALDCFSNPKGMEQIASRICKAFREYNQGLPDYEQRCFLIENRFREKGVDHISVYDYQTPEEDLCWFMYFSTAHFLKDDDILQMFDGTSVSLNLDNKLILLSSLDDYRYYAKILDHYGYILTISEKNRNSDAERILELALTIRINLMGMNNRDLLEEIQSKNDMEELVRFYEIEIPNLTKFFGVMFPMLRAKDRMNYIDEIKSVIEKGTSFKQVLDTNRDKALFYQMYKNVYGGSFPQNIEEMSDTEIIIDYLHRLSKSNHICDLQDVATTEDNLGYLLSHQSSDRWGDAKKHLESALNNRRLIAKLEPGRHGSELSWTLNNLAELKVNYSDKDNLNQAEELFLEAISIREKMNKETNGKYRDNLAWSCVGLSRCYELKGEKSKMNDYLDKAISIYEELSVENADYRRDLDVVSEMKREGKVNSMIGNQTHFTKRAMG